jgi:pyruvate/2-oxoglutarate dehydrogenase complex dihydrolipoamide acyltransferase (E2) component
MKETAQRLDYGARWLRDGLHEAVQAGAFECIDVDVTEAARILKHLKADGRAVTWTHVFIRAVSLTLARNPKLHQLVAGNKKIHPATVDICLSVAGESSVTPVVIIEDAANKDIFAIGAEVASRSPQVVREAEQLLAVLRRWGWILPFSVLRRGLLRFLFRRLRYRRKISGTFQISCVPTVDVFVPMLFNTAGVLGVGRVRDQVIAVHGAPAVRPVVTLTCCIDHSVWNGMAAGQFLAGVREVLESGDFASAVAAQKPGALVAPSSC